MGGEVFGQTKQALKFLGMVPPGDGMTDRLWNLWNYLVIVVLWAFVLAVFHGIIYRDCSFYLKLEYVAINYGTLSIVIRIGSMSMKKKQLFLIFDKIEQRLLHIESVNGTRSLPMLQKKCQLFAYGYALLVGAAGTIPLLIAYVKYYFMGIEDPIPFEIPMPFEVKNNIHAVVWYQVVMFYGIVAGYTATNMCFIILSLCVAELIRKVGECYERINELNVDTLLKQTVGWHSELIGLVKEVNSLLGSSMMVDYIFSLQYISACGFLLVKVGLANPAALTKYIIMYVAFLSCPFAFCLGGHIVAKQSDVLYTSVLHNKWYRVSPKGRRNLILPTLIASKGLSWNFKGCWYFDMPLYYGIVKQSYSFIAVLKLFS